MAKPTYHEDLTRADGVKVGSERSFGLVFAAVFGIVAALPLFKGGAPHLWAAAVAAVFLVLALAAPAVLRPLNLLWFRFGMVLHKIMTPLIMGLLFFATIMPIGLIMRAFGKDFLRLRFDPQASSYWIERHPPGPAPDSMRNQF